MFAGYTTIQVPNFLKITLHLARAYEANLAYQIALKASVENDTPRPDISDRAAAYEALHAALVPLVEHETGWPVADTVIALNDAVSWWAEHHQSRNLELLCWRK